MTDTKAKPPHYRLAEPDGPRRAPSSGTMLLSPQNSDQRIANRSSESRLTARSGRGGFYATAAPNDTAIVFIACSAHNDVLENTLTFISTYARRRFLIPTAEALSLATRELLENALNYGSVSGQVLLELIETPKVTAVRVTNDTIPARLEMLTKHLQRLWSNPEAVFVEEMKRLAAGSGPKPMLGLARVMHEAGLAIDVYVDKLRISVVARA